MPLEDFKVKNKGMLFILNIGNKPALLNFAGVDDLKDFIFADPKSVQILFKMISSQPDWYLTEEEVQSMDVEEIERELFERASKYSLIEVATANAQDYILIDVDQLDQSYWQDLLNSESHIYSNKDKATFDIIAQLLK